MPILLADKDLTIKIDGDLEAAKAVKATVTLTGIHKSCQVFTSRVL